MLHVPFPDEPSISINGVVLTTAQAMTVRVAIESFAMTLKDPNALGDDETGNRIRQNYLDRIGEIRKIAYAK